MAKITFKGSEVDTCGELPAVNAKAPHFTLVRQNLTEVGLEAFSGKKKVLNIVPSLDTGVCAMSAKTFYEKLASRDDVVLIQVSMDLPFAQGRFCKAEGLNDAETLSAFRSSFPKDYGVEMVDGPLKGLCSRAVIIIDEDDKVVYTQQVPEIGQEPDYDDVIRNLG